MSDQKFARFFENSSSLKWASSLSILAVTVTFCYKAIISEWNIDIAQLSPTDLLSIILALFSMSLSIIFYLKATETSNTFYDRTYHFTNNVSEILGRIESGFSERLRHIDEGYSRLGDKFDKIPFNIPVAEKEIEKELSEIRKQEEERTRIIEDLLNKAMLQEGEKRKIAEQLREREMGLAQARAEVESLQHRIQQAELEQFHPTRRTRIRLRQLIRTILEQIGGHENLSISSINKRWDAIRSMFSTEDIYLLKSNGFIDEDGDISRTGFLMLRSEWREESNSNKISTE
ncbi:MAG: hypothetical protein AB7G39_07260 [Alphaproteobacteria bacterium]